MAEKLSPVLQKALGAFYDAGLHLHSFFMNPGCGWHAALDLPTLIEKLGRRHGSMPAELVRILYCSQCEGKDIAITLSAADEIPEATAEHIRQTEWKRRQRAIGTLPA